MKTCAKERDGQKWSCSGNVICNVAQDAEVKKKTETSASSMVETEKTEHVHKLKTTYPHAAK